MVECPISRRMLRTPRAIVVASLLSTIVAGASLAQTNSVPRPSASGTNAAPSVGEPFDLNPNFIQNAPGFYAFESNRDRESTPIPEYVYEPEYYERPYAEVKQVADYAPAGYEARDYQSAPGVPEFSRITPPVRVTQEEREKFVVGGIVPGSFLAPGTDTSFRIRGFARLATLYDFEPIGLSDAFVPNTIPVPQQNGSNLNMSGRISRFAVESWTPTNWCERTIHTFVEMDFFNGVDQAAGGGGNALRLRHAFIDVGWFRFGQQNSVFMDGTAWPSLVDFQGPNSWTNQRQPSVRMTAPLTDHLFWATSVERPFSDVTTNGAGEGVQNVPDVATHLRFEGDRGHLQLAGLFRQIAYRPTGGEIDRVAATGISGSAVVHPWAILMNTDPLRSGDPSGLERSRMLFQATWGDGVGRYINDLAAQGLDGQVDPITGELNTVEAFGWNASYEHWFNEHWLSNATYSQVAVDSDPAQLGSTYATGKYMATSLWWIPVARLSFGVEYIWGERENLNGESASAERLHALAQYNF